MANKDKDGNSGNMNSGDSNSGNRNSGNCNSGNRNSGNRNSGNCNSGNMNSEDWNSGEWNSGNCNSGNRNSGNRNSGNCNSGNRNSGDWNSGNYNSGFFNTNKPKVRIFNKETDIKRENIEFPQWLYVVKLTEWVKYDDMTKKEKKENPYAKYTGGYTKEYDYKEAFRIAFNNAEIEDLKKTLELPNFDFEIFEEITGISKLDFENKLNYLKSEYKNHDIIEINGVKYKRIE